MNLKKKKNKNIKKSFKNFYTSWLFYFVSFVISLDKIQAPTLALNIADLLILWIWYKYIRRLVSCHMHFHSRPPGESLNPSTSGM